MTKPAGTRLDDRKRGACCGSIVDVRKLNAAGTSESESEPFFHADPHAAAERVVAEGRPWVHRRERSKRAVGIASMARGSEPAHAGSARMHLAPFSGYHCPRAVAGPAARARRDHGWVELSLNAVPRRPSGTVRFPTWSKLARWFVADLYPASSSTPAERDAAEGRATSTSGAMRLAEEYEATHDRAMLDTLMITTIPDTDFEPGPLHRLLLSLPWSDVFTTNYDTLLERAVRSLLHRRFAVVTSPKEVSDAVRPRIVKLHGTFPSIRPFVITEEDFRTYRHRATAFVNMAQQTFVEDTFCLIGFSGDDPNFSIVPDGRETSSAAGCARSVTAACWD